jgi:small subunit ribosomal protein S6
MSSYEGMFVLRPDLAKENLEKVVSQIQDIITKQKGSIGEIKEWGKQRLAYPIKKYKEGSYYLVNFHMDTAALSAIKRAFGLNESILRTLIITL